AEDGIRDFHVTGVQTCALPILYLFSALRPTPILSFALKYLNCHAGIVLTASHNPPEYNGYKVYWQDGGQLVPPQDEEIIKLIERSEERRVGKECRSRG